MRRHCLLYISDGWPSDALLQQREHLTTVNTMRVIDPEGSKAALQLCYRAPFVTGRWRATLLGSVGWLWLLPAFEAHFLSRGEPGAHLWLLAVWLGAGPSLLDMLAGWAMGPIRRAAERHMLGATPARPPRQGPRLVERVQLLMLAAAAVILMLGAALIPWVGLPFCVALGAAVSATVYMQPPLAVRGLPVGAAAASTVLASSGSQLGGASTASTTPSPRCCFAGRSASALPVLCGGAARLRSISLGVGTTPVLIVWWPGIPARPRTY